MSGSDRRPSKSARSTAWATSRLISCCTKRSARCGEMPISRNKTSASPRGRRAAARSRTRRRRRRRRSRTRPAASPERRRPRRRAQVEVVVGVVVDDVGRRLHVARRVALGDRRGKSALEVRVHRRDRRRPLHVGARRREGPRQISVFLRRRPPRGLCGRRRHESRRRVDPRRVRRRRRAGDEGRRRRVDARRAGPVGDHALDRRDRLRRGVVLIHTEHWSKPSFFRIGRTRLT